MGLLLPERPLTRPSPPRWVTAPPAPVRVACMRACHPGRSVPTAVAAAARGAEPQDRQRRPLDCVRVLTSVSHLHGLPRICSSCRLKARVLPLPIGDNKGFKEVAGSKIECYALVTSTPLESNK